jgi:hypothetical protein
VLSWPFVVVLLVGGLFVRCAPGVSSRSRSCVVAWLAVPFVGGVRLSSWRGLSPASLTGVVLCAPVAWRLFARQREPLRTAIVLFAMRGFSAWSARREKGSEKKKATSPPSSSAGSVGVMLPRNARSVAEISAFSAAKAKGR